MRNIFFAILVLILVRSCTSSPGHPAYDGYGALIRKCDSLELRMVELNATVMMLDVRVGELEKEVKFLGKAGADPSRIDDVESDLEDVIMFLGNEFNY